MSNSEDAILGYIERAGRLSGSELCSRARKIPIRERSLVIAALIRRGLIKSEKSESRFSGGRPGVTYEYIGGISSNPADEPSLEFLAAVDAVRSLKRLCEISGLNFDEICKQA